MSAGSATIQALCQADRERLARMLREQPAVTREAWDQQVKLFEKAGRDSESTLPFWRRFRRSRA